MPSAHFDYVLGSATKIDYNGENRRFSTLKFKGAKVKAGNKLLPFVYQFLFCLRLCLNVTAHLFLGDEDENIISNKERQIGHGFALAVLTDGDEGASLDVI